MTKKELLAVTQEVYDRLDELQGTLSAAHDEARSLMRKLEEIPEDASEITDDEPEEE